MTRIRFIYGLRRAFYSVAPKLAFLALLVIAASFSVSLPNVIRNMPSMSEAGKVFEFGATAFMHTSFAIQAIFLLGIVILIYLVRDVAGAFRSEGRFLSTM